jgi:hypothetical protein
LGSSALPQGSRKNIVAGSPVCPLKRTCGSIAEEVARLLQVINRESGVEKRWVHVQDIPRGKFAVVLVFYLEGLCS